MAKFIKNFIIFLTLILSTQGAFCYTMTYDELHKNISNIVSKQTKFDDFKITISGIPQDKIVTCDTIAPKIEVISQNQNFQPYSFKKVVIKDQKNNIVKQFSINVHTKVYKNCLTASETIPYNSEITIQNAKIEKKEVSKYLDKILTDIPTGSITQRNYQKDAVILSDGIKKKALVAKNSTIDIVFLSQKGMKITLQGKALKDGSLGDTILVRSDKYNKTYSATVSSENQVKVRI